VAAQTQPFKIVVAGSSDGLFAVARYNANGSPDTSFGDDGIVTTPVGNGLDEILALTIQPDGKILAAGASVNGSNADFAMVRYNTDGSLDNSYGNGGKVIVDVSGFTDLGIAIALDPIGRAVVAGEANGLFGVIRLLADDCLALSRPNQSFASSGGTAEVSVSAVCDWTATSNNPEFITVTSGSGTGNGTVTYTVAANSNPSPRIGTMTVGQQTFIVFQGAAFQDVPPSHLFYTEIGKLSARGVTVGCGGGNYCPDQVVTREQMAAFIMRARDEFSPPTPPSQRFDDVGPSSPFYNFVDRMAARGITLGCSATPPLYCPNAAVTRGQMAVFLVRAFGL
jgi:uncharacterized delta-60 repeat protein